MQATPNPRLDRLLVHYLEHAQDLINIFRLWLHPFMISDGVRALEMIRQLGLLKLLVLSLLMHLARNRLIPHILLNIVLLVHELDEVRGVHIRFQLLEHLLQLRIVLIFSLILINSHLSLHLIVIIRHEIAHFVHDLILLLRLDRLLIILQLASEEICLCILKSYGLLFSLSLVCEAWDLVIVLAPAILDLVRVYEPDIILVISDKFCVHLEDFNLTDFLEIVADLEALDVTILLELALFKEFVLVFNLEKEPIVPVKRESRLAIWVKSDVFIVYLFRCIFVT